MKWMATITFKAPPTAEVLAMLPAERVRTAELVAQGAIEHRFFAADGDQVWFVMQGESAAAVDNMLDSLPMRRFFNITFQQLN